MGRGRHQAWPQRERTQTPRGLGGIVNAKVVGLSGRGREFGTFWRVFWKVLLVPYPVHCRKEGGEAEAMGPTLCQHHCPSVYAHATPQNRPGHCRECLPCCSGERPGAQRRRHWPRGPPREQGSEAAHQGLTLRPLPITPPDPQN